MSVLEFSTILVELGIFMALVRLLMGPHTLDRLAALDLLSFQALCWIGLQAIRLDDPRPLDIGLTLALITFLGTIGISSWAIAKPEVFSQEEKWKS